MTTNASFSKLSVLAVRAARILGKYKGSHPAIQIYETTLPSIAEEYQAAYRAMQTHRVEKADQLHGGHAAVEKLAVAVRVWLGPVERDVPNFALESDLDPVSPDQVLNYAESLIAVVQGRTAELPYAATLIESVTPLIEQARLEWENAQKALGELQELGRVLRDRGAALSKELVAFRRTLHGVLGSSHRDYQLLRVHRAPPQNTQPVESEDDDEDDDDEDETSNVSVLPRPPQPVAVNGGANNGRSSVVPNA